MTVNPLSNPSGEGLSRRGLVQTLAAGTAAAGIVTPSSAQPTAVLAEATAADYVRDPTHWGSAEVAALFPRFRHLDMRTKGAVIRLRHGGSGPPLLLRKTILGACRHYRANATIDFEIDAAEKDRRMTTPLLVLWGTRGNPPTQEYPTAWRKFASNLVDAQPLPTGHALQVEAPDAVHDHFVKFFAA